jgi:protein-disulfide isomerase
MRSSPIRHRVALALALAGMAVSALTLVVHRRLGAGTGYTSFCNLGGVVNCDAILGSPYATILHLPVAAWGIAAFAAGAILALPGAVGAPATRLADLLLVGLVSASLGFAGVMGVVMATLGRVCLLCLATDLVIVAWFLAAAPLAARSEAGGATAWWRRRGAGRAVAAASAILAIAGGTLAAARRPVALTTVDEVRAQDPDFHRWYTALPVRPLSDLVSPGCPVKGPPDAPVAIVEFSDFQCPFCVKASADLRRLLRERPDVRLVFRHFPLDPSCNTEVRRSIHPDACLAACAAECASRQGRFWEYHDVLFDNHQNLERGSLFRYAREMGLDLDAFRLCLDDPATRARIDDDVRAATRAGVTSTPTLFINGRTVAGVLDPAHFDYALIIERHSHDARARGRAS